MQIIHSSNFRKGMASFFKSVLNHGEEIIIPTKDGNIAVISEKELNSWKETAYLSSIPGMAESIIAGMKEPLENSIREKDLGEDIL